MDILIYNFTDWIGYHIAEGLLNEGYTVTVDKKGSKGEFFTDFFGRNEHFQILEGQTNSKFSAVICIGDYGKGLEMDGDQVIFINSNQKTEKENVIHINVPLLFGEWMPMDENGVYMANEHVPFSSTYFQKEAIYITEIVDVILKCLNKEMCWNANSIQQSKNMEKQLKILDKSFFVQENTAIEESIQKVLEHYRLYTSFYPI